MSNSILLSTAWFAPVHYYALFSRFQEVYIEQFENFNKQTFRNRCEIYAANGKLPLVVPVVKGRGRKIKIKDLQVSYDEQWQRTHWKSVVSAYNTSPFFEYYQDDLVGFFEKKYRFLLDLNVKVHEVICNILEIDDTFTFTEDFEKVPPGSLNFREQISPKVSYAYDPGFMPVPYTQVFSEKHGFIANLSILDLIFNEGPNSLNILIASIQEDRN